MCLGLHTVVGEPPCRIARLRECTRSVKDPAADYLTVEPVLEFRPKLHNHQVT